MNPKVAGVVLVAGALGAAVAVGISSGPTQTQDCELLLPDGGVVAVKVSVPAKANPITACADAAVKAARGRVK